MPIGSKNNNSDSKAISLEGQISEYETENGHIGQKVNISGGSQNKVAIAMAL